MSNNNNSKGLPKVVRVFDIRLQEVTDKETKQKTTKPKVVFGKGVEVFMNGHRVDLGEYQGGFLTKKDDMLSGLDRAVEKFGLDSDFAEKQKEYIEDKNISSCYEVFTNKK